MATYYRWRRRYAHGEKTTPYSYPQTAVLSWLNYSYRTAVSASIDQSTGKFTFSGESGPQILATDISGASGIFFGMDSSGNWDYSQYYELSNCGLHRSGNNTSIIIAFGTGTLHQISGIGGFIDYVYSTSSSAYPNGGEQNGYYYDQRTTVTSPTAPTGLTYPNPITTPTVTVSWNAATSYVPYYQVAGYTLAYQINGDDGTTTTVIYKKAVLSAEVTIPNNAKTIRFIVISCDTNGAISNGTYGDWIPIAPILTVPQQVMEGEQITVSWSNVGADSYTLQRKASTDADWTTVYTGGNLTFSETVGTWTTVQYRVRGNTGSTPGPWATSPAIWVVGAGALVISGEDGSLGTITNDIIFAVSTDTGSAITGSVTVNGTVTFSGTFANGQTQTIPVLDLPTGTGTIVIEASVQGTGGEVDQARTWTYTKTAITFPNGGAVALLHEHISGRTVFPETLAECVRLPGGKTLDEVMGFPCQVYAGSYVGTGTYGQSNPNSLTFPFTPKLWGIYAVVENTSTPSFDPVLNIWDWVSRERVYSSYSGVGSGIIATEITGNSVSWYSSTNANVQLNDAGDTYYYFALGTATEPGVFLETPQYAESGSVVWNFSIPSGIEIPESGAVNVTVTMTRDGDTPTWTNGRYVTYAVDGADGSGTTAEALIRSSADEPAPTFTIQITNANQKAVYIRITNVSTSPG